MRSIFRSMPFRSETGSSIAAVLMVIMVITAIGLTSVQLARHSTDATTVDRERVQALNAAEAGVHEAIGVLQTSPCDLPDTQGSLDQGEYVFSAATEGEACVIHSLGTGRTGSDRTRRLLRVEVAFKPLAFTYTLFSATEVQAKNNATILGDVYATSLHQSHNALIAEDVVSPGDIVTKNNATYGGMIWSGGNVHLNNNTKVVESVIAGGNIVLENGAAILGDALAGGSISAQPGQIGGTATSNSPNVPEAPVLGLPDFRPQDLTYSLPSFGSAQAMTDYLLANSSALQGVFRVEGSPGARVILPDHANVVGPLTIVTNGKIELGRSLTGIGGPHQVVLGAQNTTGDAIDVPKSFTGHGLDILLFSYGGVDAKNRLDMTGAIYAAGVIDIKNNLVLRPSFSFQDNPPVGFDFSSWTTDQYLVVPTMWREVPPSQL
jgi:hypothetical protein